ncbi:MAG TPA: SagB/ThcOx family dehydrogenase [candidate division Zixibacteria bacterium]|nr:SagB/ThcOx family dehydrogenase [candidate division Zixibacteria bacterium]
MWRQPRLLAVGAAVALGTLAAGDSSDEVSIGQRFHAETSFTDHGYCGQPQWGRKEPVFKVFEEMTRTSLPNGVNSDLMLQLALQRRHSTRDFAPRPLPLPLLARVLGSAYGLLEFRGGAPHHTTPSAGGLYPLELYVAADNVAGLEAGLYHFQTADTSLEMIDVGTHNAALHEAANGQYAVGYAPATLVITARFERMTFKYADRGYRYAYMEAGAVCQNVYLQCEALGLGTVAVGAFNDERLSRLIEIDGVSEAALLIMPIGYPAN